MVIRRKIKAKAKVEAKAEITNAESKPSQSNNDVLEDCMILDGDGSDQLSIAETLEPIDTENGRKGTSNEGVMEFSQEGNDEEIRGETTAMQEEEIGKTIAEVTTCRVPHDNMEELQSTAVDEKESLREELSKFEADEVNNEDFVGEPVSQERETNEAVNSASSSKEAVEAEKEHAGLAEDHVSIGKKDGSSNSDATIGNDSEANPRKVVKKIVKRLVKRKVLVNQSRDEPQSSVVPEDGEQEKEKVNSPVKRTRKIVKKVVKRKALANQARVEPSLSEVPKGAKPEAAEIVNCEAMHEGEPNNEVNKAKTVSGKKNVLRKNGVPVTAQVESKLIGKGKVVHHNKNMNNMADPTSADEDTKARMPDGTNVDESRAETSDKDKAVESEVIDKKPGKSSEEGVVEAMEGGGAAKASASKSSNKGKSSKKGEWQGMIFMCTSKTKKDCFQYNVLGLPSSKKEMVLKVQKEMRLFLFDVDSRKLYGIYRAAGHGGYNLEPKAFNSSFPSQVRFTIVKDCPPLPEQKFKQAIKDNYFTKNKFSCQLKSEQVKNLCKLFESSEAARPTGANGSNQQPLVVPAAKRGKNDTSVKQDVRAANSGRRDRVQSGAQDGSRQDDVRSGAQDASRQDRKRSSRADDSRQDRKRRRGRNDEKRERGRRRNNTRSDPRNYRHPALITRSDYPRDAVGYERRAYAPPLAFVNPMSVALPPPREASPPNYGRTSLLDSYRRDHDHHRDQGLAYTGAAPEYNRRDPYYLYRDPLVSYADPYAGGRGHQDPYYPSSSGQEYYSPRTSRDDYLHSTVNSSEYLVPRPPYRRY